MHGLSGKSRYVTVDGINIHYVEAGQGSPVMLYHGLASAVFTWRGNMTALSRHYRVFAFDVLGHGDSDKPDVDYYPWDVADVMGKAAGQLGLSKAAVIGNSAGGALGMMMAIKYPDLVSSLVLVGSSGLGKEVPPFIRLLSLPFVGNILQSHRLGGTRQMLQSVFYDRSKASQDLVDEMHRIRSMPGAKEAVVRTLRRTVNLRGVRDEFVLSDRLSALGIPIMLVWGAQDTMFSVSHAYRTSKLMPAARLEIFDQCGHWPHMEKAEEFNTLALDFLSSY
ncbi:MAG: alpha/beta fold hydrolase [Chloroflexi bacterium]|nr:alpha/beta fold hydrolase [Chloroflexota bacterium]MCI0796246.1 alpha/beta fold hydrolase [Chloroflexota bacterium]MCI0822711.1 alpha/beta fold hydrolase [Chloroflexota bacterium]